LKRSAISLRYMHHGLRMRTVGSLIWAALRKTAQGFGLPAVHPPSTLFFQLSSSRKSVVISIQAGWRGSYSSAVTSMLRRTRQEI
jgi:hypothetical protein